jgi:hypothetical protein
MKKPINEIKKLQLIAGLITESEYHESMATEGEAAFEYEKGKEAGDKEEEEKLKEGMLSSEAYERMDSLVNENDMDMLYDGGRNIVADLTNEGFEDDEVIEFICQSLKKFL